ncbi:MAG: GMC family oxidoreductase N-terminal domain-containing protein, partial [Myxococcales bacterium]
ALGWKHGPAMRNAPGCDGSGFCDFGCRTDARRGTNLSYVPPALEKGSVLFTGLRAERVLMERGRAAGVEGVTASGRRLRVRAPTVILAGGAVPTPLFLLGQGLANRSGQVGRNLSLHPSGGFHALMNEEIRGASHMPQGYVSEEFLEKGILILAAQPDFNTAGIVFPFAGRRLMETLEHFDRIVSFGLLVRDAAASGRVWRDVGGIPAISYNLAPADLALVHEAMVRTGEMALAAGAGKLYPVALGAGILEGRNGLDAFRSHRLTAKDVSWTSYHPLGTCKMGRDPATSVVDLDHQCHDVPGLYIVDGSTVPGPLGVNPQITIMGMATRAASKIAERLGSRTPAPTAAVG